MRNDIKAGGAYVELMLRNKRFQSGLAAARKSLGVFAKGVGLLGGLIGGISFASAIKAASDLEETMNKFNVVFGSSSKRVKAWGDDFAKEVGRSEKQIAEFLANTQDLFVPLGFEPGSAEAMSKQITGLAIDLASFNNMQDGDTIRDLHAALTGSGEVMKKYGVVLSEAAVKQELLNQKMDPKKATDQQKVMARMNIILRGTTAAQGDAVRSAGGFANQVKNLQGRLVDLAGAVGTAFLPTLAKGAEMLSDFLTDMTESVGTTFAGVYDRVAPVVGAIFTTVQSVFAGVVEYTQFAFTSIATIVGEAWGYVTNQTGSQMSLFQDFVMSALSGVSFAFTEWRTLLEMATTSAMLSVVRFSNQVVYFFGEVIPGWLKWLGENWYEIFTDIASFTGTVAVNIWNNLASLWDGIVSLFSGEGFTFEWTPLTEGFESAIKQLPQIAEREMGPLEKQLQDQLNGLADNLVNEYSKQQREFDSKVAAFTPSNPFDAPELPAGPDVDGLGRSAALASQRKEKVFTTFSVAAAQAQGQGGTDRTQMKIADGVGRTNAILLKIARQKRLAAYT